MTPLADGKVGGCDVVTIGWLVKRTAEVVVIAHSISEANDMTGTFVIPRSCVKRLDRL
jgi:hypothetical protein